MASYHYNAFISYNHNPRDIRIARRLQHQLENYKIPKGVKTASGLTKIERVFLDTGELEVAGDLNKVICDVLEDTDYLIVICSPESKKSIWVQREIEYYLRNHTIDSILTVITDGEPFDVLPEVLLYEDYDISTSIREMIEEGFDKDPEKSNIDEGELYADEEGSAKDSEDSNIDEGELNLDSEAQDEEGLDAEGPEDDEKGALREPLSCDYRLPEKVARTTELPRLVAAIIGCRYDDLVQRQRHYRMRRLTIAASVSSVILLTAISYLIWSNNQIKTNLNASLREQSGTLAMQSEQALRAGDKVSALRYALEALPSEGNQRPIVSKAVRALSQAMGIYKSSETEIRSAMRRYPEYGKHHLRLVTAEKDENSYMAELFTDGRCRLWDAESGKELVKEYTAKLMADGTKVQNLAFAENGNLIAITSDSIRIIDPSTEEELSNIKLDGEYLKLLNYNELKTECDDLIIKDDHLWIPVATIKDQQEYDDYEVRINSKNIEDSAQFLSRDSEEMDDLVVNGHRTNHSDISCRLIKLNLDSGKVEAEAKVPKRPFMMSLSFNNKYLVCGYSDFYDAGASQRELPDDKLVVLEADTLKEIGSVECPFVSGFGFDLDNKLIVCGFAEKPARTDPTIFGRINYTHNGMKAEMAMAADRKLEIRCIDPATCSQIWRKNKDICSIGTPWLRLTDKDAMFKSAIICTTGNCMVITDYDGNEIANIDPIAPVALISCDSESLSTILQDGAFSVWSYKDDHKLTCVTQYNLLLGPVIEYAEAGEYMFVISTETEGNLSGEIVTQYEHGTVDPRWEAYGYDEAAYDGRGNMRFVDACHWGDKMVEIRTEEAADEMTMGEKTQILIRDSVSGEISNTYDIVTSSLRKGAGSNPSGVPQHTNFLFSGVDCEKGKAYFLDNNEYLELTLLEVDLETGKETQRALKIDGQVDKGEDPYLPTLYDVLRPADLYTGYQRKAGIYSIGDGHITYASLRAVTDQNKDDHGFSIVVMDVDPETGEAAVRGITDPAGELDNTIYVKVRLNDVCKRMVIYEDTHFATYDYSGKMIWSSEELGYKPGGFVCADDGTVLALEDSGSSAKLHVYSAKNGSEVASVKLGDSNILSHEVMDCEELPEGERLVVIGDDAYMLDGETWEIRNGIYDNYIAYNPQTGQFMVGDPKTRETGHVPYRTIEEMIQEAHEMME